MIENKSRGAQGFKRKKGKGHQQGKGGNKLVILDKSTSVENATTRKARTRIVLIMVNLVTLLVIALNQR